MQLLLTILKENGKKFKCEQSCLRFVSKMIGLIDFVNERVSFHCVFSKDHISEPSRSDLEAILVKKIKSSYLKIKFSA